MTSTFTKAVSLYKASTLFTTVDKELAQGNTAEDNNFLQGVSDNLYSLLSKTFTEEELEEVEVGEVIDTAHN